METISQREMRNSSGEVLRRVAGGESFLVTNHGRPVAVLSPVDSASEFDRLVESGAIQLPKRKLDVDALPPLVTSNVSIQQMMDEDRGDR